jgi:hypothetical protein
MSRRGQSAGKEKNRYTMGRGADEHIGRKIDEQIDRGADEQLTEEQMKN